MANRVEYIERYWDDSSHTSVQKMARCIECYAVGKGPKSIYHKNGCSHFGDDAHSTEHWKLMHSGNAESSE